MLILEALRVGRIGVIDRVEEVDRVAIALGRRVAVVQVGGHLGDTEILRGLHGRQLVLEADQHRLAVLRPDQRPGDARIALVVVEAEEPGLSFQVGMELDEVPFVSIS